jgi:hypothetical protein
MPTIQRFLDSDAFFRGLMGPFGSGKSSACVMEIAQRGIAQPPCIDGVRRSRWGVVRNTNKQLEDTTERTFLQWFPPITFGDWVPSKHNYTIRSLKGEGDDRGAEIEVMFRALDRPDQISDLLSMELTGAWVNEAREIPWPVIDAIQGRLGRYPKQDQVCTPFWYGMWADTNPPDADSDWFRFFEETDHSEAVEALAAVIPGITVENYRQIFKQPSGLSPNAENLANLPEGYYHKMAIGKSPEWVRVYIHGEYGFVMDGKAVWPEYSDELHCPSDPKFYPKPFPGLPIVRGWDSSGLTPACVFTQVTPRGQWIVFDEVVTTRMGATAIGEAVLDHCARNYRGFEFEDVGDPAGQQVSPTDMRTYFQVLHGLGIPIEPAIQTLEIRLESVRKPLRTLVDGRPQFVLHPRCKTLRRGLMGGYHFRRMRLAAERYTSTPEKNQFSHVADALGYAGTRVFGTGIIIPNAASRQLEYEASRPRRSAVTGY